MQLSHGARVGTVDSLRCFAMTGVVAQHCGLLPFGWTGVWLFFVISGYVVTLTVISRHDEPSQGGSLTSFFSRRLFRIVPIYYAYIVLGVALILVQGTKLDLLAAGSLFGFFNNTAMIIGRGELAGWPVGHLWTISSEMQFYLIYGLALFTIPRRAVVALLVVAVVVSPLLRLTVSCVLGGYGWDDEARAYAIYAGPLLHADAFAAGALLAFAQYFGVVERIARPLALAGVAALVAYATLYVHLNHTVSGARGIDAFRNVVSGVLVGQHREVLLYTAVNIASSGAVALAATQDSLVHWMLRPRLLQRIGEISYGAYVYHALAIVVTVLLLSPWLDAASGERSLVGRLAVFVVAYLLTLLSAEASYRWYERWFIRYGAGLRQRGGKVAQTPLAAAE